MAGHQVSVYTLGAGISSGTNKCFVDPSGTSISGSLILYNDIVGMNTTSTTIQATKLFIIRQSGDTYGTTYFRLAGGGTGLPIGDD